MTFRINEKTGNFAKYFLCTQRFLIVFKIRLVWLNETFHAFIFYFFKQLSWWIHFVEQEYVFLTYDEQNFAKRKAGAWVNNF